MADVANDAGSGSNQNKTPPTRAELRRRKILESSEDRLAKLTGKSSTSSTKYEEKSSQNEDVPEVTSEETACRESESSSAGWETRFMEDTDVPGSQNEDWQTPEEQLAEQTAEPTAVQGSRETDEMADEDCMESENNLAGWETRFMEDVDIPGSQGEDWIDPQDAEKVQLRWSKLTVNILRLLMHVLLAVVVNILFLFNMGYVFGNVIFFPFAAIEAVMWCCEFGFRKESTLMASALMMCGIPPSSVRTHTDLVGALSTCCSDYCVYFFSFVMIRQLCANVF